MTAPDVAAIGRPEPNWAYVDQELRRNEVTRGLLWQRVRVLRDRAGLTQTQLAKALGKNHKAVGRLERGEVIPGIETIIEIARVFGTDWEGFFRLEKDDPFQSDPHILMPVHRDDQKLVQTVLDRLNELRSKKG